MTDRLKVLLIDGSPRGKQGNTYLVSRAFIEGMGDIELKEIPVYMANIQHCRGCLHCLKKQPGYCSITDDDMAAILQDFLWADLCIWSMPVFAFGIPSKTKALIDRMMPMFSLSMDIDKTGSPVHPLLDPGYRSENLLISTGGFPVAENNFEPLVIYMERRFRDSFKGAITVPQGPLIRSDPNDPPQSPEEKEVVSRLLDKARAAGAYYIENRAFSKEILDGLKKPMIDPQDYINGTNEIAASLSER